MGVDNYIYSPKYKKGCHLGRHQHTILTFSKFEFNERGLRDQPYPKDELVKHFENNLIQLAEWMLEDVDGVDEELYSVSRYCNVVALKFMEKYPDREYYFIPDTTNNFNYACYDDIDSDELLNYDNYWKNNHGPHRAIITQGKSKDRLICIDCGKEFKWNF